MQLIINNLTSSTRTYLSGAISVAANGSTSVTNTVQQLSLATDGGLHSDVVTSLVTISDGTNTFGASDALNYLLSLTQNIGPVADGLGNLITSTTVTSKQALDVNVASSAPANNILATGTLTGLSQTVTLTLQSTASVNVDVSGPGFVGTITVYENTPSSQRNLGVFALNSSAIASNITTNGNYRVVGLPTSGAITVSFSTYTSGSATINIYGSTAPYIVQPYSANAANVLVTSYINDGTGNSLTSTSINSKQRLDINTPSEGADGATAPSWSVQIAGKDGNGNLQSILTDTLGTQVVTSRSPLTGSSPTSASIGTSSSTVIAANTSRRGLVLTNTSNAIISLDVNGGTASLRSGITLYPGGVWDMDEYTFTTSAITGIASAAASNLAIQEFS